VCDGMSCYVILIMFFSHFQRVLQAEEKSIRTIAYDFEKFLMFYIFEFVILFFLKHSNFRIFCCKFTKKKSCIRQSKTYEDL